MPMNAVQGLRATCALLSLLIGAAAVAVAGATGSLAGVVTDENGAPLINAVVRVQSPGQHGESRTDNKGAFVFASLTPGNYTVTVEKDGYYPISYVGIVAAADQSLALSFKMPKIQKLIVLRK